jgi:hypothetical protein
LTLAFIDASSVTSGGIQWKADVSNVLVPVRACNRAAQQPTDCTQACRCSRARSLLAGCSVGDARNRHL